MTVDLAVTFRRWGEGGLHRLPMYRQIALATAEDPSVRDLLLEAPVEQQLPVLLFAVVHDLLLGGADHRLAQRYPTVGAAADLPGHPYPDFRDFVLGRRNEVAELVGTRRTQTNEIGRCSVLRPAWAQVTSEVHLPLGLVELGASAGLNLLLDRWAYSYLPDGPRFGDPAREVVVEAQVRGAKSPGLGPLRLASRIGIDLNPIDVRDDAAVRWLLACVWPENLPRFQRLKEAIALARAQPPQVIAGDIVDVLPSVAADVPADQHLAVQSSWVLNYLSVPARRELFAVLAAIGAQRDLSWVSMEGPEITPELESPPRPDSRAAGGASDVVLLTWRSGHKEVHRLAECHPHGTWLRWR